MQDPDSVPTQGRGRSVLIVEDEFLIAMDLGTTLERNGDTIAGSAGTVEAALRLLRRGRPDVAVLDVNLGSQLVIPVAERLRKLNIPFVVSSATKISDDDLGEVLRDAENVGKPFNEVRLMSALGRAVGRV